MKTNNKWASKMGFILATAGAAIGLPLDVPVSHGA